MSFRSGAISTSGFVADILSSRCPPMSDNVGSAIFKSGVVENVGVAVGVALLSLSVQESLLSLVSTCQFLVSKPPYWHFRSVDTQGDDVILYSVHLGNRHFKPHLFIWSGSGAMTRKVVWGVILPPPPLPNSCSKRPLP